MFSTDFTSQTHSRWTRLSSCWKPTPVLDGFAWVRSTCLYHAWLLCYVIAFGHGLPMPFHERTTLRSRTDLHCGAANLLMRSRRTRARTMTTTVARVIQFINGPSLSPGTSPRRLCVRPSASVSDTTAGRFRPRATVRRALQYFQPRNPAACDTLNVRPADFVCATGNLTCVASEVRADRGSKCGERDAFVRAVLELWPHNPLV